MNAFLPGNLAQYLGAMRGLYGNPGQPQPGGAMMPGGLPMGDGGTGHAGFPMQTGGPGQMMQAPQQPQFPGWLAGGGQQPEQMGRTFQTGGGLPPEAFNRPWLTAGGGQPPATASSFQPPEENDPFGGYRGNFGRGMLR